MRKGERNVLVIIAGTVISLMIFNGLKQAELGEHDREIPFYSTADRELMSAGGQIYKKYNCKNCHTLWTIRNIMQSVPAPALDGIGSIRTTDWIYNYLSSENPQSLLPSRLKAEYQMPSYASIPEDERRTLADFLGHHKVKDWYLDEAKKAECRKLTGEEC